MELLPLLVQEAKAAGFPVAGAIDLDLALQDPEARFALHLDRYDQWIEAGYAGKMEYLVRGRDRRADPRLVFPQTQSLFCVALPYPAQTAGAPSPDQGARYARYLQGPDYHEQIAQRLEAVMQSVQAQWIKPESAPDLHWKVCVDTSAILERTWASLAGLGWIGKNTLLIHPQLGSYLFLAEVLINQRTGQGPQPLPSFCGNCTRCLGACPTQALIEPGTLDSNHCIAYWTLEKRGALEITEDKKAKIKNWIAGCDLCQEACPFNFKAVRAAEQTPQLKNAAAENATLLHHWLGLLRETQSDYRTRIKTSALNRVKPAQFSRNLAIALTNALPSLYSAYEIQSEPEYQEIVTLIQQRFEQETDEIARLEWKNCAESMQKIRS